MALRIVCLLTNSAHSPKVSGAMLVAASEDKFYDVANSERSP